MIAWLFFLSLLIMSALGIYLTSKYYSTPVEGGLTPREAFSDFRSDHKKEYSILVLIWLIMMISIFI